MSKKQKGQTQLEEDGFTDVVAKWGGVWFVAKNTNGEEVCFLRQGPRVWHAFYRYGATGSGETPRRALTGGLGDVIDTAFDIVNYGHRVRNAPDELVDLFDGLYAAGTQVVN